MHTVKQIRKELQQKLAAKEFVIDKSGVKTIEIIGATFIADEPTIFGEINDDYIRRELEWYDSESLYVTDLEDCPAIWKKVSSDHHRINSNYGWCIYSDQNHNQFDNACFELTQNIDSRRAIMIYTRPSMHYDYALDGMDDFICTNTVQFLVRDNKLHMHVCMRSNDVVFGYRNDYAWQKTVQQQAIGSLMGRGIDLDFGDIIWTASSLHVYERHFNLLEKEDNQLELDLD